MFSKKTVLIVGLIIAVTVNIIVLSLANRNPTNPAGISRVVLFFAAPLQKAIAVSLRQVSDIWHHYFDLVATARDNERLRQELAEAVEANNRCLETEMSNRRLRALLRFQKSMGSRVVAAEVVGRDPSTWFRTVIIDKGRKDGVVPGMPVAVSEGIVGQVAEAGGRYSKVLLMIDQNSAVDALIQRTRARGVIKGGAVNSCRFDYVLRKHDVKVGDVVVASGLDGVYHKGLRVGRITEVIRPNAGIFQKVTVTPFVDFEKLEEVLVLVAAGEPSTVPAEAVK
jgi:rod shape-determining protein MreC